MADTIFRGYSIRFYNPIIPTHRAIPWSRGLYLASHFPRILSIPKLVLIFLLNPESRASNTGNHVSRNSLINPVIYSVRLRQFRVAIIESTCRNISISQAEKIEKRLFGRTNAISKRKAGRYDNGQTEKKAKQANTESAEKCNQQNRI